jgi:putative hydrolase of the HAD superfamily
MAVISNCIPDLPPRWEGTALAPLVDAALFSCIERVMKPDSRIFELACERLGVSPEDCLYVADGEGGELAAASAMGMRAVLIRSSYRDPPRFRRPHVEAWDGAEIAYLREVLELV